MTGNILSVIDYFFLNADSAVNAACEKIVQLMWLKEGKILAACIVSYVYLEHARYGLPYLHYLLFVLYLNKYEAFG